MRRALAALLLLAGCAAAPTAEREAAAKPVVSDDRAALLRAVTDLSMAGFAQYCMGGVGRPAVMTERLKADGFTAVAEEATPAAPFRREVWRADRRPFFVAVIEGGAGCTVVAPLADGEHAAALLARAMQRVTDEGGPVVPLLVPANEVPGDGAREERYQIRPLNGPVVMDIRLRTNAPGSDRPALILVATIGRDNATRT